MTRTNFDRYLDKQLRDPAFAARFKSAGEAWDVALQIAALREKAGLSQKDLAKLLRRDDLALDEKLAQEHALAGGRALGATQSPFIVASRRSCGPSTAPT